MPQRRQACRRSRMASGIEVDALGGRPGVRSARFAGTGASDARNLSHLMSELHAVPDGKRQARYQCVIVFIRDAADPAPRQPTAPGKATLH